MSADNIRIIEVRSELGAGTRGASLGVDAVRLAALSRDDDFFTRYPVTAIQAENQELLMQVDTPFAKRVKGILKVYERIAGAVSNCPGNNCFHIVLAGDHSTAAGTVAGLRKTHPHARIGVIWIDAHADIHSPYTTPSGNMHGMPVAAMLGIDNTAHARNKVTKAGVEGWEKLKTVGGHAGKIGPEDLVYVAVRDYEEEEAQLMQELKLENITVAHLRKTGADAVVKHLLQRFEGYDLIYISFDVDSMDTSISVGTGTPVKDGLFVEEVHTLVTGLLASPKVACFELVEVNPLLDTKNHMAEVAFEILKLAAQTVQNRKDLHETG